VVLDAYSRRVVGWSIDANQAAALVTNALGMALENRSPAPGTILHSDHGTQFASWTFTTRAKESGLLASMGSIGDCFDNAVAEAFWARMQVELLKPPQVAHPGGARQRDLRALDSTPQRATVSLRDAPRGAERASPLRLLASGPVFLAPDEEDALRSASELAGAQAEVRRLAGELEEAHTERDGLRDQADALGKALRDVREEL
jgi:transposase InsO family protein